EFRDQIALEDLAVAIKSVGSTCDVEAKRFAATHCVPFWKALASTWFQKCRKRRQSAKAASPAREALSKAPAAAMPPRPLVRPDIAARAAEMAARNVPLPKQNVTTSIMG